MGNSARCAARDDSCPTEIVWYWHVARKVTNAHANGRIRCSKYRNSERIAERPVQASFDLCVGARSLLQRWIIPSNHCRATTKHPLSLGFCSIRCFPRVSIVHFLFVPLPPFLFSLSFFIRRYVVSSRRLTLPLTLSLLIEQLKNANRRLVSSRADHARDRGNLRPIASKLLLR